MANQLIGVGRVYVEMTIHGMTADDWQHLERVVPRIEHQSVVTTVEDGVEIQRDKQQIRFIYEFLSEGEYVLGVECHFDDSLWSRSYRNDAVTVTDAMVAV